jgi:hypothetical protein
MRLTSWWVGNRTDQDIQAAMASKEEGLVRGRVGYIGNNSNEDGNRNERGEGKICGAGAQ